MIAWKITSVEACDSIKQEKCWLYHELICHVNILVAKMMYFLSMPNEFS